MVQPFLPQPALLLAISEEDTAYVSKLGESLKGIKTKVFKGELITLVELVDKAKRAGLNCCATTRVDILKKLLPAGREKKASIHNYSGSIIPYGDFEFLIIDPLKQLFSVPYGEFLTRRYLSKLISPQSWRKTTQFRWKLIESQADFEFARDYLTQCDLVGVDTETRPPNVITCSGYCGVKLEQKESYAFVVPMESLNKLNWIKELNQIEPVKVMQNGNYDNAQFFAWSIPLRNYYLDTVNAFHAHYAELPKDLSSVSVFYIRDVMYWKDLAHTGDKETFYKYNALDCWATVESMITWLIEAPDWAKKNYVHEFTQIPICHMMDMTGIKRDEEKLIQANAKLQRMQQDILDWLQRVVGFGFNPSSPPQVLRLIKALTGNSNKFEDSNEKTVQEVSYLHPLNELVLGKILEYRGLRKLTSTYLPVGMNKKGERLEKEFKGRILYTVSPHTTDTGRKSSKEHHFWCGLNIQNIPRDEDDTGALVKETLVADDGWELWEADFKNAEGFGVAYKSGDKNLLDAVLSSQDFHSLNASRFFGVKYDKIFDDTLGKVVDKALRNLSKRTNHGANYNMGAGVMLETMGSKKVREAHRLLNLPKHWALVDVCQYLLTGYEKAYPTVKTDYYQSIKFQIKTTHKLVSDTGWTRWCFGDPSKSKPALNSYVAHITQNLNAMLLDRAVLAVFLDIGFEPNFKLLAQIHDSILFMVRKGHSYLAHRVKELMTFAVPITDCKKVTRMMQVPVDLKYLGQSWAGNE